MADPKIRMPIPEHRPRSVARHSLAILLATTALGVVSAHAVDGTWVGGNAGDPNEWTEGANWTSNPNAPDGTATFTNTGVTTVANDNGVVAIGTVRFTAAPNAQAYTININNPFVVSGSGFINDSTNTQTFNVSSGNSLVFQNGSSARAGAGAVTINNLNGGSIYFQNTSTAGSATIVNNSILQFNDTSTAGTATITNNIGMDFFDATSAGSANITNAATGTLTFNNTATASTSTITNNGGIQFNNSSTAGSANITNGNNATLAFSNSSSAGNATITNNSGGNTNFLDQSTAASAAIVNKNGGATTFGVILVSTDTATAGNANITNNSGGSTEFTAATTAGNATILNKTGGFLQFGDSGGGTSTATAGNAAITNSGATSFNAQTTAGNSTITTNSGGNVFFFDTSTGGSARFITNTGGTFDMSTLTAAGMTAGSIEGAGNYVLGARNLAVGGNNLSTTVSGVISGTGGSLTKVGSGAFTLSNTNSYTGATTVNGGTLIVDGSTALSSLTTVNTGGVLAGSGTVGNTAIAGGTLAPGSATGSLFGPLTVQGTLSFAAASTYMIQVTPANAGRTNVTGIAIPGSAAVSAVFAPGSYVDRQYTILNATSGVNGTFNPTVISNNPNLSSTLSYDPNDVFLNIKLSFVPPPSGSLNVNQQNVANALTGFFNSNGGIPLAFAALNAQGLTTASGELGTGVIQSSIKADDLFLNLLLDPSIAGRAGGFAPVGTATQFAGDDEASTYAAKRKASPRERDAWAMATKAPLLSTQPASRWSVWGAAYGGSATTSGNAVVGSHDTTARVWGVVAGTDYRLSPDTLLGFAVAGGGTNYSLGGGLGNGSSDLFQAGAFGRHNFGPAYVSAALAYGWHDLTTNRTVALAGVDQLQARFRADTFSARFEGGYRFATPMVGITPYTAAQMISFHLPNYAEQSLLGGGLFALNYVSQTTTATRTELGLRSDKSIAMLDAVLTLRGRAAWAHDYNPDRAVTALFQALPGASFVVNGARGNPDAALVSAGAEMKWLNGFSLMATFGGEFSGNTSSYSGKGVAKYTW